MMGNCRQQHRASRLLSLPHTLPPHPQLNPAPPVVTSQDVCCEKVLSEVDLQRLNSDPTSCIPARRAQLAAVQTRWAQCVFTSAASHIHTRCLHNLPALSLPSLAQEDVHFKKKKKKPSTIKRDSRIGPNGSFLYKLNILYSFVLSTNLNHL